MIDTRVSFALIDNTIHQAWVTLSKAKFLPHLILCHNPSDFIIAGWLRSRSESCIIGNGAQAGVLLTPRCKVLLLSSCSDNKLDEYVSTIHASLAPLPSCSGYSMKTLVLFSNGYPVYDFEIFQLPYKPTFPWEKGESK